MAIAKGRSCAMVELDSLKETLENMVDFTETRFNDTINSLKANIFDIEHDDSIDNEERNSALEPYFSELENYQFQRYSSRNNYIICIYSICESVLASICADNNIKLLKETNSKREPKQCSNTNGRKNKANVNYYMNDYLYSLNPKYRDEWTDAFVVSTAVKKLRNYLTHGKTDRKKASIIAGELSQHGLNTISQVNGEIKIQNIESLHSILKLCCKMLVVAEQKAKEKSIKENK